MFLRSTAIRGTPRLIMLAANMTLDTTEILCLGYRHVKSCPLLPVGIDAGSPGRDAVRADKEVPVTGRLDGKVAVVTGASSGIGRAVAERFLAEGAKVLGVARDATKLAKLRADLGGGEDIAVQAADLSE